MNAIYNMLRLFLVTAFGAATLAQTSSTASIIGAECAKPICVSSNVSKSEMSKLYAQCGLQRTDNAACKRINPLLTTKNRASLVHHGILMPRTIVSRGQTLLEGEGYRQAPQVADELDVASLTGLRTQSLSGKPDVVGAFRLICPPSHISWDDPIVHPGQPGANMHLHIFFGNTRTDANSTYESLRTTGDSTCFNALNRSAYWQPALVGELAGGEDVVIVEEYTNFYYKRRPKGDPGAEGIPISIPRGLRFVFGDPQHPAQFKCVSANEGSNVTRFQGSMQVALAACATGQHLVILQSTPECWNGSQLDSDDHRSHLAYPIKDASTGWKKRCPATHPYLIPKLTYQRVFTIRADDVKTSWHFDHDVYPHADYMMAWDDLIIDTWTANCIDKLLNCSAADLGNATGLKKSHLYKERMAQAAVRVPIPARGQRAEASGGI
ncbi:DUF1996 domain-containing protein [Croceibacterium salegens]|nr:DUF1996 domain-containing protein [Croceibacterium salegens]